MRFSPLGGSTLVEDRFLKISTIRELAEIEVVTVIAHAVERLIERSQTLLAIEHQKSVLGTGEHWRAFKLPDGEHLLGVTHAQDTTGWVVARNRDNQFLCRARFPN